MRFAIKIITTVLLLGVTLLLGSCVSQTITLAPVGPSPFAGRSSAVGTAYLQVFSDLEGITESENPSFYQHTDYNVYDAGGKLVKHVGNTVGHYSTSPRLVPLRPGNYTVRARAKGWLLVNVPVVVERDRTTKVHLDENWKPPAGTPKTQVVSTLGGYPAGWRANLSVKGTKG